MLELIGGTRRLVIAAISAALLAAGALAVVAPAPASAAIRQCPEGEFCLYFNADANGGFYHFVGSDRDLHNDRYEAGDTAETVANTARNVWNNGRPGSGRSDVIVYGRRGWDPKGGDLPASRLDYRRPAAPELVEQHRVLPLGDQRRVRGRRRHLVLDRRFGRRPPPGARSSRRDGTHLRTGRSSKGPLRRGYGFRSRWHPRTGARRRRAPRSHPGWSSIDGASCELRTRCAVGSRHDAEDLVQETYERVLRRPRFVLAATAIWPTCCVC